MAPVQEAQPSWNQMLIRTTGLGMMQQKKYSVRTKGDHEGLEGIVPELDLGRQTCDRGPNWSVVPIHDVVTVF